ncbi:MAG: Short-chain dehydrogenase/reductase in hypothetical Actinobacterial gene cluster, partial [uncultured Solirubrobacteraceae bacterium]
GGSTRRQGLRHHGNRERHRCPDRQALQGGGCDGRRRRPQRVAGRRPVDPGRRHVRGRGARHVRADGVAVRRRRRALQQRGHLPQRRHVGARDVVRGVAARAGRQPQERLPVLQARDPAPARAQRRQRHQHRVVRRDPRGRNVADLLHGLEGRRARAVPRARRAVRPPGRARQRAVPGPDRHPAAAGALRERRGGRAAPARPHPHGTLRTGPGDRQRRPLPGLGRVELRDRLDVHGRRRDQRCLRHAASERV